MARRHGIRGIVIKNHYGESGVAAYLVSQAVPGIEVYGGIALNLPVGGINPFAVENMTRITGRLGRIVWLPTFDAEHDTPDGPNVPIQRDGELLPEVREVFDIIRDHDLTLATGHVSPEEVLLVVREARAAGIDRIIVTHPGYGMSREQQSEAARMGALLEYTILSALGDQARFERWVAQIRAVGPENVVLTSDLGQVGNPVHADGYRMILPRLAEAGFSRDEIETMTRENPARALGLD